MNRQFIILLFLVLTTSFRCARAQYTEDVSQFRPVFEVQEVNVTINDSSTVVEEYVEPSNDDTKKVEGALDILAERNGEYDYVPGYRIQIYSGTSEGSAQSVRSIARSYYSPEELPLEMKYELPNFKVKAGDFVDKLTAYRWLVELKKHFPRALLVPEQKVKLSNVN